MIFSQDRLYIHDGPDMTSPTIQGSGEYLAGRLGAGGNDKPRTYVSTGQDMYLRFVSDGQNNFPGFLIEYEQGKFLKSYINFQSLNCLSIY